MLQSLLLILWLVFGIMAVSGLFYKNHYDNQIPAEAAGAEKGKSMDLPPQKSGSG